MHRMHFCNAIRVLVEMASALSYARDVYSSFSIQSRGGRKKEEREIEIEIIHSLKSRRR